MKYSLAKYSLTISTNDPNLTPIFGESLTIGGQGSTTNSISVNLANAPISIDSYSTGGYVFNQTFDRHGTASIQINQLSDAVARLKKLLNAYYTRDFNPFTIVVSDNEGNQVVTCKDCHLSSVPSQAFGSSAENQTWEFTVGEITYVSD